MPAASDPNVSNGAEHVVRRGNVGSHTFNIWSTQGDYAQVYNGNISGDVNNNYSASEDPFEVVSRIHKWLEAPDHEFDHREARKKHVTGTCQWFLSYPEYENWVGGHTQTLWLHGKAGCCKTILCSTIIEAVRLSSPGIAVAYFYFTFREVNKQRYQGFLLSAISQFLDHGSLTTDLRSAYERGQRHPEALQAALDSLLQKHDLAYLVIDALDECPEANDNEGREEVMRGLHSLATRHPHIKLLITSRKETDISDFMQEWEPPVAEIAVQPSEGDIEKYVHSELEQNRKLRTLSSSVKNDILRTLTTQADGMFRWVHCILDQISSQQVLTAKYVTQALRYLPKSLDDTYHRILIQFSGYKEVATALRWLAFSETDLTVKQLRDACITSSLEDPYFDEDSRPQIEVLIGSLSSLIRIGEDDSSRSTSGDSNALIQLAHFSVKEYLVSERIQGSLAAEFFLSRPEAHHTIAQDCMAYVLHCCQVQIEPDMRGVLRTARCLDPELAEGGESTTYAREISSLSYFDRIPAIDQLIKLYPLLRLAVFWTYYQEAAKEGCASCTCSAFQLRFLQDVRPITLCHNIYDADLMSMSYYGPNLFSAKMRNMIALDTDHLNVDVRIVKDSRSLLRAYRRLATGLYF